jgi:hypothetical protein
MSNKFEQIFNLCKKFSEDNEIHGFPEFDFKITIFQDRTYCITFEFAIGGAVPIYIIPSSDNPISQWYECPNNWMDEKGKEIIIYWIIKNIEIFVDTV